MNVDDEDPYRILGLDSGTVDVISITARELASAYRKQAFKYHPDKNPDDAIAAENLARIFLAYETLKDPSKRKAYDDRLRARTARLAEAKRLNIGRRRMREDLIRREGDAVNASRATTVKTSHVRLPPDVEQRLRQEIEQLRTEFGLRPAPASTGSEIDKNKSTAAEIENSPWADIPGFKEWYSAQIDFDDLEAAVLARAKGLIPGVGKS